jgi:riboflavin kinase / FMN adenylyltransferase
MSLVFRSADEARGHFGPSAVTIGNFDGIHLGHQFLVNAACKIAEQRGWASGVLTFDPHPRRVLVPGQPTHLLTTLGEKLALLSSAGAQRILVMAFTQTLAQLAPEAFVRQVLVEALGAKAVVVGEGFRFGHKQAGTCDALEAFGEKYGFQTRFLPKVRYRGAPVSSSLVRHLIHGGAVGRAGRLLGRCYGLSGRVVKGQGVGSKQTVPTLNLETTAEVLPAYGVYISSVTELDPSGGNAGGGRRWPSITNVGVRPTFNGAGLTIESYLLTPLTGDTPEQIRVDFRRWVREERKFADASELKAQILKDVGRAQAYWRRLENQHKKSAIGGEILTGLK